MRFPEFNRAAAEPMVPFNATLPICRDHTEPLLRASAIENEQDHIEPATIDIAGGEGNSVSNFG